MKLTTTSKRLFANAPPTAQRLLVAEMLLIVVGFTGVALTLREILQDAFFYPSMLLTSLGNFLFFGGVVIAGWLNEGAR